MKKAFKFSILILALAMCSGSIVFSQMKTSLVKQAKAVDTSIAFDNDHNDYYSASQLVTALESINNRTFTIKEDINFTDTIDMAGKTTTIELAGHTLSCDATSLFSLSSSTNLTINSTDKKGTISCTGEKVFYLTGANLNLSNIKVSLADTTTNHYLIQAASGTNVIRANNLSFSKGYTGILLGGNSSFYASEMTTFTGQDQYSISCLSSSSIYLYNIFDATKPIYTNSTINLFNGVINDPVYLSGFIKNDLEIIATSSLMHEGDIIVRGIGNQALISRINISGLAGTGYDYKTFDSSVGTAKDIKTVYYSCTPRITGSKFTIISQTNPATYTTASYNAVYELQADLGYYFGSQRNDYLTITIGGGSPLTSSDYSYGYTEQYYGAQYYKRCTITIPRNKIKGQLVIAVTPGISNYLQTAKNFIASYMHMDDYDPELTGVGTNLCKSYYTTALTEFLELGNPEREALMLSTDTDVIAGRERFTAWADANGDKIVYQDGNYNIVRKTNVLNSIKENNNDIYLTIIIASEIAISSIAVAVLYAKKRKESSK